MTGEKNDGFVFIDRFICLEELCKLCHISKRKAKWLLDNEIIPCVRSGSKRHRYIMLPSTQHWNWHLKTK